MISIRKSLGELERLAELHRVACDSFANAITSAGEYAIELNASDIALLREDLRMVRDQLDQAASAEDFRAIQANFRGELREYRDQSAEWLQKLQLDVQSAALVMETLAGNVATNGINHEKKLDADLVALAAVQSSSDLAAVKRLVRETAASISESWQQLRRANQVAIAQLRDEIRSLHREMDSERRAQYTDPVSGAWNRQKIAMRLEENLNRGEAFALVLVTIGNLKRLQASYSNHIINGALKAVVKRLHGLVGNETMVARWSDDQFAVLLEIDPAQAVPVATTVSRELSTRYSVQEKSVARTITLRVDVAIADRSAGSPASKFRERLAMIEAPLPA